MEIQRMSLESFKTPVTSDNIFVPKLAFIYNGGMRSKLKGNCLIEDKILFTLRNSIHFCVIYELQS